MEQLATIQRSTFDFEANKVEVIDLPTLRRTNKEINVQGMPLLGIHHFEAIERVEAMCRQHGLNFHTEEIFAARSNSKTMPGVTVVKNLEEKYGAKAVEAHVLRRVYTTVRIKDHETDDLTTTLVLAYHQDGIQAAIGPCVIICHNQCIMRPEMMVADYGKNKVTTEQVFERINEWLRDFEPNMTADRRLIERLKATSVSDRDVLTYFGMLTAMRVAHDSRDKRLSSDAPAVYPLNQSQITDYVEAVLKLQVEKRSMGQGMTAWDLYDEATRLYKPQSADFPTLIPQNFAFMDTLNEFMENQSSAREVEDIEAVVVD